MPDVQSFTIREYRRTFTFTAKNVDQLADRLYRRTSWTIKECTRVADLLFRGVVFSAPDFEVIILPGTWEVLEDRPGERPSWTPDTPLLSGGIK